jgi:hypothetical protein
MAVTKSLALDRAVSLEAIFRRRRGLDASGGANSGLSPSENGGNLF